MNIIMASPMVSVVVPAYNAEKTIESALNSILEQTFQDFEVIVVDDGSKDGTPRVVREMEDSRIRLFEQENQGAAVARNRGIEESRGELIAFLDDDDLWYPEKLEKSVRVLQQAPEIGLVYHRYLLMDVHTGKQRPGKVFHYTGPESALEYIPSFSGVHTSTVVTRRSVLEKVGVFDPLMKRGQDVDLWLRIMEEYPLREIPEVLSEYRMIPTQARPEIYEKSRRSSLRILDKALKRRPDLYQKHQQTLKARLYLKFGKQEYNQFRMPEAREWLAQSLREKWTREAFWYTLKSFLPTCFVRGLRKVKKAQ